MEWWNNGIYGIVWIVYIPRPDEVLNNIYQLSQPRVFYIFLRLNPRWYILLSFGLSLENIVVFHKSHDEVLKTHRKSWLITRPRRNALHPAVSKCSLRARGFQVDHNYKHGEDIFWQKDFHWGRTTSGSCSKAKGLPRTAKVHAPEFFHFETIPGTTRG